MQIMQNIVLLLLAILIAIFVPTQLLLTALIVLGIVFLVKHTNL